MMFVLADWSIYGVIIELFSLGVIGLRLRRYERISIENRRFPFNGVSLAQNFR